MILEYICLGVLGLWILFFIYVKIAYPFWSHQPVVHTYDWVRRVFYYKPYIIQRKKPIPTKYNKKGTILTKPYLELSEEQQNILIDFIQCHYYASENMFSVVSKNLLNALLAGSEFSHVSLSYHDEMKIGLNEDASSSYITKWIKEQIPLGIVCSYELMFYMPLHNDCPFQHVNYWAFMAMHREKSEPKQLYDLLQTHDYRLRLEKEGMVSLYKKEGEDCKGVVPLVHFTNYVFPIPIIKKPPLEKHWVCSRIHKTNFHLLSDMLYNMTRNNTNFPIDILVSPTLPCIQSRIEKELNYVYIVEKKKDLLGLFVFQDSFQHIENEGNILDCSLCFLNEYGKFQEDQFFGAFLNCLGELMKQSSKKYTLLNMNDLGHGVILLEKWRWKYKAIAEENGNYYLFNAGTARMSYNPSQSFVWT